MKAGNECAQWAAAFLEKVAKPLFRQSQAPGRFVRALQLVKKASQSSHPQVRKGWNLFFPAACTSEKTLLGPQVCELSAESG